MIKDRGNIKWSALMLSEHREALKKLKQEERDRPMLELDTQQLEELDFFLRKAVEQKINLKIVYYQDKRYHENKGILIRNNYLQNEIIIKVNTKDKEEVLHLSIDQIISISFL